MRVEMMVNEKMLPKGGINKITAELEKRLNLFYSDVRVRVRKGSNNQLEIYAKDKDAKKQASKIIEQAFNEADEWLSSDAYA
ncbi:hypothetical protein VH1709_contig00039-0005 [Vibrio harveyi]|uniref:DinI-like family protein n=1 Tax=Vibrio harveyi TaxID=669 RepID=UPI000D78692C|nr:DinI-like family protein [Vibrio harveyi]GBK99849.1 hypothetical protein VH1709_contig00039-0005 [Vibrio harveyi]